MDVYGEVMLLSGTECVLSTLWQCESSPSRIRYSPSGERRLFSGQVEGYSEKDCCKRLTHADKKFV